jgi:hypothetical protein
MMSVREGGRGLWVLPSRARENLELIALRVKIKGRPR